MAFPWQVSDEVARAEHRAEVYRQELGDRALLLCQLKYSKKDVLRRLQQNVDWDYEVGSHASPVSHSDLGAIVDRAWHRAAGPGSPISL